MTVVQATTPMMRQYQETKAKVPGKILFFRMGDFYELFGDDAIKAAPILGIALTSRDKKNPIPMCGIPYHAVSSYIIKLTQKGYSVAICEQLEDPKNAKGVVKRDIVRVVTPSLVYDSSTIDGKQSSYLVSLVPEGNRWAYAFIDYTTGEFKANTVENTDELVKEISLISPREVIYQQDTEIPEVLKGFLLNVSFYALDARTRSFFDFEKMIVDSRLSKTELKSGRLIINYLMDTQFRDSFPHIRYFYKISSSDFLGIDEFTSKNLDLFTSFLDCMDESVTPMGARFLKKSISQPLKNKNTITKRLNAVEVLSNNFIKTEELRNLLSNCSDAERLASKVAVGQYNPRDLKSLLEGIETICIAEEAVSKLDLPLSRIETSKVKIFASSLLSKLEDQLPATLKEGGIFKYGVSKDLDELITIHTDSKSLLMDMERSEKKRTGISSLKIKYNRVFGYYIEITNSNLHLVPDNYQRKQTLVNGERFITSELREMEIRLLTAEEKRISLEHEMIESYAKELKEHFLEHILSLSLWVAELDLLLCFAWISVKRSYKKPNISDGFDLFIKDARHPVLDITMGEEFVPNDIKMDENSFFHIITGPNMAGKSTLMRTAALIVIMSHLGCFIPASHADISIVDKVFTRVGATDHILKGQSTFMVEMIEASNIIQTATKSSLIILDEIGRGTSTYDGISIAWAIAEYIHNKIGAKCMFATHYHELTSLEGEMKGASNFSMSVEEEKNGLFFLRKLVNEPSSKSYGIQVAAMAGLPDSVIKKAYSIMKVIEGQRPSNEIQDRNQLSFFDLANKVESEQSDTKSSSFGFIDELSDIDLDKITPLEALNRLYEWKKEVDKVEP